MILVSGIAIYISMEVLFLSVFGAVLATRFNLLFLVPFSVCALCVFCGSLGCEVIFLNFSQKSS